MQQLNSIEKPGKPERVVLPLEVREVLGWEEKEQLEVWIDPTDNKIVIKKHVAACICCSGTDGLKDYKKLYLCADCRKKIARL